MLASGHISEYLIYWGNLYGHSQQGWEAFNSLIKTFFFCRTGCGRAGNKGCGTKSKLCPIVHWLSCHIIWMCGYHYHEIVEQYKSHNRLTLTFLMIMFEKNTKVRMIQRMNVMMYMYGKHISRYFYMIAFS